MSKRFIVPFAVGALLAGVALVGCSTTNDEPLQNPGNVMESKFEAPVLLGDKVEQRGFVLAQMGTRAPHEVRVNIRSTITRGDADTVLTVEDTTAGTSMDLTIDDQGAEAGFQTAEGVSNVAFNADGTMSIGDNVFTDAAQVAQVVGNSPAASNVTQESLVAAIAAIDTLDAAAPPTDRGGVGRAIRHAARGIVVWLVLTIPF